AADPKLPRLLGLGELELQPIILLLRRLDLLVELPEFRLLLGSRRFDVRLFVAEVVDKPLLRDVVEIGEKLVVLLLRDGVEFVIVAAGAAYREAKPHGG